MVKQAAAQSVGLEPIDRLEEKLTLLVSLVGQLRAEQAQVMDQNTRLSEEVDGLRTKLADSEDAMHAVTTLRDERDVIRSRVGQMLQQLEQLSV
jgi:regulator of replication initiation timing